MKKRKLERYTKLEISRNILNTLTNEDQEKYKHLDRHIVQDVLEEFMYEIKNGLADGKAIELRSFGTFVFKLRKGRKNARNPKTGEGNITVRDFYTCVFKPGKDLKELGQQKYLQEKDPEAFAKLYENRES